MGEAKSRKVHTAEFKAKVGLEAIRNTKTISQIAQEFYVHPVQVGQWICKTGQPDVSIQYYQQAIASAKAATDPADYDSILAWTDVAAFFGAMAHAFHQTGQLESARVCHERAAEAKRSACAAPIGIVGSDLEVLRIDILQGHAKQALPPLERLLAQVEEWWQRKRSGLPTPEAPDLEVLARVYTGALGIAMQCDFAREDWESALRRSEKSLDVERHVGRPPADIAASRGNRASILAQLKRFGEARRELEECLHFFENDPVKAARTLGALANLYADQGDLEQAITQERRALAMFEQFQNPEDRATSHYNIACHFERCPSPIGTREASLHEFAALVYRFASRLGHDLQHSLRDSDLKHWLDAWLARQNATLAALQSDVDGLIEQLRAAAMDGH